MTPFHALRLVLRSVLRARARTTTTILGCALGGAVLAFFLTAEQVLGRAAQGGDQAVILQVAQKDRFCPTSSNLPDGDSDRLRSLPQVAEVMPVRLKMSSCSSTTDVVVIHGVDKEALPRYRTLDLDSAGWSAFRADPAGAIVGARQAERSGWRLGQSVTLDALGVSFTVAGIFRAERPGDETLIFTDRSYLQQVDWALGQSHHALVRLTPDADPDAVARAIDALPLTVATTTRPEHAVHAAALSQLADLVAIGRVVIATLLVVLLVGIGNAMAIATRERRREFGIMRTLGYRPAHLLGLVLGEGLVLALAGAAIGCLVVQTVVGLGWVQGISTCGFSVPFDPDLRSWLVALAAVGAAGIVATWLPAWGAMRVQPVQAMATAD